MSFRTVNGNRKEWADKLDDDLWAFRTADKLPIRSTPFRIVYEKACHLLIEIERKSYWALRHVNLDLDAAGKHRKVKIKMALSAKKSNLKSSRLIIMWSEYYYRFSDFKGNVVAREALNGISSHVAII
ncbi:hypothetical protein Tco_0924113 [Tanacetum coccineum]|uniref:Uncharacterized protein n=1 Tax=Tanacetum coccineum TaxID=301880 RepID=A0ABQ5D3Z4_9ASTR